MIEPTDLAKDPLNSDLHWHFALQCCARGDFALAYAEFRTAATLGAEVDQERAATAEATLSRLPGLDFMNHNSYFRFHTLSTKLRSFSKREPCSVLDIGGGRGELAQFLPEVRYCLAEPAFNGISGLDLPFDDRSFDYVLSCHVLEHIELEKRDAFLDQMWSKASRGMLLLNPFEVPGTHVEERLKLSIDITDSQASKEHLKCKLPKVEAVRRWADSRGVTCTAEPKGTLTAAHALLFLEHVGQTHGLHAELNRINQFYNTKYIDIMDSPRYPGAYLVSFLPVGHEH